MLLGCYWLTVSAAAASLLLLLLLFADFEPTFGFAFSLKSLLMVRIFLSPPPGLWFALSNEPIFDLAFHWSLLLIIYTWNTKHGINHFDYFDGFFNAILPFYRRLWGHKYHFWLRCEAVLWNPIFSFRFWCCRHPVCVLHYQEIQFSNEPDANLAAVHFQLWFYSLKLKHEKCARVNRLIRKSPIMHLPFFGGSAGFSSNFNIRDREELRCMTSSWLLWDDARLLLNRLTPAPSSFPFSC